MNSPQGKAGLLRHRRAPITRDEANAVLRAAWRDNSLFGIRDTGIIVLLLGFGMTERQLCALEAGDYLQETGVVCLRSPTSSIVRLSAAARLVVDRWISVRGFDAGPLFCPILRPSRIVYKPLRNFAVNEILTRRASQAGVVPFRPSDVIATHGKSSPANVQRSLQSPAELFPLVLTEDAANRELTLCFTPSPIRAADTGGYSSRLLVFFLTGYVTQRRSVLKRNLDALAREISDGKCDSSSLDWCTLSVDRLPSKESLLVRFGMRKFHAMCNAFHGLLRVGLASGVINDSVYTALIKAL